MKSFLLRSAARAVPSSALSAEIRCAPLTRRLHSTQAGPSTPSPFYCTTPIFYVNANPHIGHLHSCVLADVLTRWNQIRHSGWSTASPAGQGSTRALLATGTDEHGLKVQKVAESQGVAPKELCDRVSQRFRDLADAAGVNYSTFIRTTERRHADAVHEVWSRLKAAGHIYKGVHEGWYAVSDEAFYPAGQIREVVNGKTGEKYHEAIETGQRVEWTSEENYKFRMSDFRDHLIEWLERNPDAILPRTVYSKVLSELQAGLEDLSISRPSSRLKWGIPVPDDASQTIYVWVDALVNYLTVTGFPAQNTQPSAWPADVHVVGKDIIRFHAIYWPSILLAASLPVPRQIVAHSHWTMDKSKMSKSRGNVVDPFQEMDKFGRDTIRFFLCRVGGGLAADSDYSHALLRESYRRLQGQLGNLASRISSPKITAKLEAAAHDPQIHRDRGGWASQAPFEHSCKDITVVDGREKGEGVVYFAIRRPQANASIGPLNDLFASCITEFEAEMERCEVSRALDQLFRLLEEVNARVAKLEPWLPSTSEADLLAAVYDSHEVLRITSILLSPFMPEKMQQLRDQLGMDKIGEVAKPLSWDDVSQMSDEIRVVKPKGKVKPLLPPLPEDESEAKTK